MTSIQRTPSSSPRRAPCRDREPPDCGEATVCRGKKLPQFELRPDREAGAFPFGLTRTTVARTDDWIREDQVVECGCLERAAHDRPHNVACRRGQLLPLQLGVERAHVRPPDIADGHLPDRRWADVVLDDGAILRDGQRWKGSRRPTTSRSP